MNVTLSEVSWLLTDDCAWFHGWVGLSSGNIQIDEVPYGDYIAAWYPNLEKDLQMLVSVRDRTSGRPTLSVALTCPVGHPGQLAPVPAEGVPWEGDGVLWTQALDPAEIASYGQGLVAVQLGMHILRLDSALRKYIHQPALVISSEDLQETL
ncbi:MAG TPA: hypothetical protein VF800_12180 [Telluria sp.]|jgi:hypothetical protein